MIRQWKYPPKLRQHVDMGDDQHWITAHRNDDVQFQLVSSLPLEEMYRELDTYLDPRCECRKGNNCDMHSGPWQEKIRNA